MQPEADRHLTIMITRPRHQATEMQSLIEARGASAFVFPTVEIRPLEDYGQIDDLLRSPMEYDWLMMTSANGVAMLVQRAAALGMNLSRRFAGSKVAAIGSQTALALEAAGLRVDLIPPAYVGESLAHALIETGVDGKCLLSLRSELARETLIELLQAAGAEVVDLPIYTTTLPEQSDIQGAWQALEQGKIDCVSFTSASAVRNFAVCFPPGILPELLAQSKIACIGPVTAQTAHQLLGRVDYESPNATIADLVEAMLAQPPRRAGTGPMQTARPGTAPLKLVKPSGTGPIKLPGSMV